MSTETVIYARQSLDRAGDELAVERQLLRCRELCAERGWTVATEYVDNDRSATKGERPQFAAMLKARPDRIVVWHIDRLVRLTKDLERVIELGADVHAVKAGHLDLSNPAGRAVARTVTAWSTYEGEQKAARQREKNDQLAAAGLPYKSHRPFGYEADGLTIREAEATELRRAAEGVLNGRSLNSLAKGMNERGVLTATGATWRTSTLKAALLSPRNAGLRRHRGEVIGKAAWPPILDEDTATAVRAVLTDPARRRRGPARRYLLSGVMTCGKCGGPTTGAFVNEAGKGKTYRCMGHVSRKADRVDEYVLTMLTHRLSRADAREAFRASGQDDASSALLGRRRDLRSRLDGLASAYGSGGIDLQALTVGTARVRRELEDVERQISAAAVSPDLTSVVDADDVAAALAAMPQETQREIIRAVMDVRLLPMGRERSRLDAGVEIVWKDGASRCVVLTTFQEWVFPNQILQ